MIRRTLAREHGFALTELLVGMTVSLVVIFAALGLFEAFNRGVVSNDRLTQAQDSSRTGLRTIVRTLRDAGAPTPTTGAQPATVLLAGANDLVFRSTSWPTESATATTGYHTMRYCLNTTTRTLYFDGIKAAAVGSTSPGTACPSTTTGWTNRVALTGVLNNTASPVFTYSGSNPVRGVAIALRLEAGDTATSRPVQLTSGAAMRGALAPQVDAGDITVGPCEAGKKLLTLNVGSGDSSTDGAQLSATGAITVGPGKILVNATGAALNLTVTNVAGLQTLLFNFPVTAC